MKDRMACVMDDHNNCASEQLEDALMQCGDLLDIVALTQDGTLDIYDMAEKITSLLGRGEPLISMATSDDEEDDDDEDDDDIINEEEHTEGADDRWVSEEDNVAERDRHLLLAGYSDCMTEALRYLVEEERYSPEHPVVEGLRSHLSQQQDRVLLEAARSHHRHQLDNSRPNNNNNNNRMALVSPDSLCNIRPPAT